MGICLQRWEPSIPSQRKLRWLGTYSEFVQVGKSAASECRLFHWRVWRAMLVGRSSVTCDTQIRGTTAWVAFSRTAHQDANGLSRFTMGLAQFSDRRREKKNMEKIIVENRKILESIFGTKKWRKSPNQDEVGKSGPKSGKHRGSPEHSLANRCNGRNAVGDRSFKAKHDRNEKFALNRLRGADLTGAERWLGLSPRAIPRHVNPTQFKCR